MAKVYVITTSCVDSGDGILGVFTSRKNAEKKMAKANKHYKESEGDDKYGMNNNLFIVGLYVNTLYIV